MDEGERSARQLYNVGFPKETKGTQVRRQWPTYSLRLWWHKRDYKNYIKLMPNLVRLSHLCSSSCHYTLTKLQKYQLMLDKDDLWNADSKSLYPVTPVRLLSLPRWNAIAANHAAVRREVQVHSIWWGAEDLEKQSRRICKSWDRAGWLISADDQHLWTKCQWVLQKAAATHQGKLCPVSAWLSGK